MAYFIAEDSRIKSLPKAGRELWLKVANKYVEDHGEGESSVVSAIRIAWSAVDKAGYKKGTGDQAHKWLGGEGTETLMKSFQPFMAPLELMKVEEKDGAPYFTLRASGPKVDRQNERMSPEARTKMIEKAKAGGVELIDHHYASFPMAKSDAAWEDPKNGEILFGMKANPKHPFVPMLMDDVQKGDHKYHTSVGGAVIDASWEFDKDLGKAVRVLKDVDIDHVAITRKDKSAYPFDADTSFVGAIMKQLSPALWPEKRGESMNEVLELLKKAADAAEALAKSASVTVSPEMFEGTTLKKEFEGVLKPLAMTPEQKTAFASHMTSICKGLGISLSKAGPVEGNPEHDGEGHEGAEGGTGKNGKVERRSKTEADKQSDSSVHEHEADGPGSDKPHQGNGSAAEKSVSGAMMTALEGELKKAQDALTELKKDHSATRDQMLKATLEVGELRKQLFTLSNAPAAARPLVGGEKAVRKDVEVVDPSNPAAVLRKSHKDGGAAEEGEDGEVEKFVKTVEETSKSLLKSKAARTLTKEEQDEAASCAKMLKAIKSVGGGEAYKMFGTKKK